MTRFDVALLSFRILAVYLVSLALEQLVGVGLMLMPSVNALPGDMHPSLLWLSPSVLLLAIGTGIFLAAGGMAARLFPGSEAMRTATRPEYGALALKLCGLLLLANSLPALAQRLDDVVSGLPLPLWQAGLSGALGLLVFLAARPIATRLFGRTGPAPAPAPLAHAQAVAFSVLGLWLLANSLSEVAEALRDRIEIGSWSRQSWGAITLASLGLVLFFGGAGFSGFWHWLRHAGLNVRSEPPA